jgi:Type IV secretory pathway, TrbL components
MSLNTRAKNVLIISGTALICVGAMVAVLNMSSSAAAAEPASSASSSPSTSMVVSVPPIEQQFEAESGTSSAFVPSSGASQAAELTEIQKPTSAPPDPSVASGTNLTDKTKKPSYSSSSAPAKSSSSTPKKASSSTPKKSSNAGDNDPVFGNTQAPHGEMTTASDMYEDGVKVGIMD